MAKLTLSLGSNQGDRPGYLAYARAELGRQLGPLTYASAVVSNPAWGPVPQDDYLNQIVVLSVAVPLAGPDLPLALHGLLDRTQAIEAGADRRRDVRWGPRTLDIDLIFLDDIVYEDSRLSLPHPWWWYRPFVRDLLPPGLVDPYGRILDPR